MHDFKAPPHLWPRIAVRTVGCCVETFCCGTGGHEGWQWLWRWDGAAAGGEPQSDARSLENMAMASGKLGGVAGVFLGNIWWWLGMLASWKNELSAVSNCQWAA